MEQDSSVWEDISLADPPAGGSDADSEFIIIDSHFEAPPQTPSSTGDDDAPPRNDYSDQEESQEDQDARDRGELVPRRKPGGYDSRVEQMLYENPEMPILITDAGKSQENGRYIVYTIKTGVWPSFRSSKRWRTLMSFIGAYSAPEIL